MLGKLMKHEFKALGRYFLPMFAFLVVLTPIFSLIIRLTDWNNDEYGIMEALSTMSIFGYIFIIYALFIAAYILIVIRFYRTTATSEAYLTFTLPATPDQILVSKWLTATIWQLFAFIMMIISIVALVLISGLCTPGELVHFIGEFFEVVMTAPEEIGLDITFFIFLPIMVIVGILASTLQYYCCVMIGQLFNEHRVLASIGIYVAMYLVMQVVSTIVMIPVQFSVINTIDTTSNITVSNSMTIVFLVTIGLQVILGIVYYIVTSFIMKKKLNVR